MDLGLVGQAVRQVDLDGFSILLWFTDGSTIRIETDCVVTSANGARIHVSPESAAADTARWKGLVGRLVVEASADEADSSLTIVLDGGERLQVAADPDFEAWGRTSADGGVLVAPPGGGPLY
jgi:hypothetical protein